MNVFDLRTQIIGDYSDYVRSFVAVRDERIRELVQRELDDGYLWPEPLVQLNPSFEPGEPLSDLIRSGVLHPECLNVLSVKDAAGVSSGPLRLYRHQVESILAARAGDNYVLTTGTGSGKSLSYIVPIVDHVLRLGNRREKSIKAIVIYPMNSLANSQQGELEKYLCRGYSGQPPVTFRCYTGQESEAERNEIIANPPDILLTNYVMLELVLTRPFENELVRAAQGLRFLVLDELHTYRGRQGADVAMLVRRVREACGANELLTVGTSATMASGGTWTAQRQAVASVATTLFGSQVLPERVIGETLRRVTPRPEVDELAFLDRLRDCVELGDYPPADDAQRFVAHPVACWVESNLGVSWDEDDARLTRCPPKPLRGMYGAAAQLAIDIAVPLDIWEKKCVEAIQQTLLAGYRCRDNNSRPIFAFRLHQFVSKGESVYASPEPEGQRFITLQAQQYVPNSERQRRLIPLAFCRECGQEYYVVRRRYDPEGRIYYEQRELSDRSDASDDTDGDDGAPGYLYINTIDPWPSEDRQIVERLPDSWLEIAKGLQVVRRSQRDRLPREIFLSATAVEGAGNQRAHFIAPPFLFCLHCGVTYNARQTSDFGKLATLGSEGRSTATTVMTMSAIRRLRRDRELAREAQKLLSFTDNRQDASLQAGHFNDFIEIGLLRSALWRAVQGAGASGLRHEELTRKVFETIDLQLAHYAVNPQVEYFQREETERALRQVLGYYLYRDLRRGWRVTSPNLEQCGLLDIDYHSLPQFCADNAKWSKLHAALGSASPQDREKICRVLLDYLRRELAIRVGFLDPVEQEGLRQLSSQYLVAPWSLDDQEHLERSRVVFPRSRGSERAPVQHFVYLSPRGGFGLYLKRSATLPNFSGPLKTADVEQIVSELFEALVIPGLLQRVMEKRNKDDAPGYQLNASALLWKAGTGQQAFHDPVRLPNVPESGLRTNRFFTEFYRQNTDDMRELEAREHTAQVPSDLRKERETKFREGRLPILYCSPTMELGVDIAELNVVNLRNVPPTPANYAQRSGRAGRGGQPAFVFTYCSTGSPHDQYFFKHPEMMVAGVVTAPRLDLNNEDLLRAHVHAVWLGIARLKLGDSLGEILDVRGENPTLEVLPEVKEKLEDPNRRKQAHEHARAALGPAIQLLLGPDGGLDEWLERVLRELPHSFENACRRWRDLYRAALGQSIFQAKVVRDASRDPRDREQAKRLRNEAEAQLRLLVENNPRHQADFYSYRYFASEGFLPGYNFPRLPLSAYLPGRRRQERNDDFLSRPRFLAISEFGPRSIIYHEGSRYEVNKVILPVDGEERSLKRKAAQCGDCGYLHPYETQAPDRCERCGAALRHLHDNLYRMQNVATRRRDRINSDEEERFRLGYEIKSGVRFANRGGVLSASQATLTAEDGTVLATLTYGNSATLWRMNLGWRRRSDKDQTGYMLDMERGWWARNKAAGDDVEDQEDPMSPRVERVIPYVEDHRNCILLRPGESLSNDTMASLEAALKAALQVHFQLEDRELSTEPLPGSASRRLILIYEASEGGAGVLRRLVEDPRELPRVARIALELCHFNPDTLDDRRRAATAREDCEAACYNCLLSYYNQRDHRFLDRKLLNKLLQQWMSGAVATSPAVRPRAEQVERLMRLTGSELERRWLTLIDRHGLKLPSGAQNHIPSCNVRLDFLYQEEGAAIFIDGPHHDTAAQRTRDSQQQDALEDTGYSVIRFHHAADWHSVIARYPGVFGEPISHVPAQESPATVDPQPLPAPFSPEDYEPRWHGVLQSVSVCPGISVTPGEEVMQGGRVIDLFVATVSRGGRHLRLVDASTPTAGAVAAALKAQGQLVVRLQPEQSDAMARILAEIEA